MSDAQPAKNYLPGGIILCAFPATIVLALYLNQRLTTLPACVLILLALLFLYGLWTIYFALFNPAPNSRISRAAKSLTAAGFATFCFVVAWTQADGWSSNLPFLPDSLNQSIPRILFALAGLLSSFLSLATAFKPLARRAHLDA